MSTRCRLCMNQDAPLSGQVGNGHNRWHPHIKPRIRIASGTRPGTAPHDGEADVLVLTLRTKSNISRSDETAADRVELNM